MTSVSNAGRRTRRFLRIARLGLLLMAFTASAMATDAIGAFSRTLKVSGQVDLEVTTGSGNVTVKSGDTSNVFIEAKIHANNSWHGNGISADEKVKRIESNPPIQQNGNSIVIDQLEDRDLRQNVSIDYTITVPTETKLRSQTGSGDQKIQAITGPVRVTSGSGNISAMKIVDEVHISTGSGEVSLEDIKGTVYTSTGSGSIEARGIAGKFSAETGSGDVTLRQDGSGDVVAKTGSGNVKLENLRGGLDAHTGSGEIEVNGQASSNWRIQAGSGNIVLRLPSQAGFDLDARSSSGNVTVSRPVTIQGTMRRNRLQGKVGSGGSLLSLETGSGDIRVD